MSIRSRRRGCPSSLDRDRVCSLERLSTGQRRVIDVSGSVTRLVCGHINPLYIPSPSKVLLEFSFALPKFNSRQSHATAGIPKPPSEAFSQLQRLTDGIKRA
jgi:hypothetical protein